MTVTVTVSMKPPPTIRADRQFRLVLLEYFLECATSAQLTEWLRNLGAFTKGSADEKRARVRSATKYIELPAAEFPQKTICHLERYSSAEHIDGICQALQLDREGPRDLKWRRIMRQVAFREGWLVRPEALGEGEFTVDSVLPYVDWHLVMRERGYERDLYPGFQEDMQDLFGPQRVHEQLPVASGTNLKIDFHLGHPLLGGVGVVFKLPTNTADLQRAIGQIEQYQGRYAENLIVVLFPRLLDNAQSTAFVARLSEKGVAVVCK